MESISKLSTEQTNDNSANLDQMSALEIVTLINKEDQTVALAVQAALPQIAAAVELIAAALAKGGRLFYIGAGTSGRLGVLDASECPPTFGIDATLVQGLIAGGDAALVNALEGAEDDASAGADDLQKVQLSLLDVVVGIAASGRTPYVAGALAYAREVGAATIALSCNAPAEISKLADVAIEVVTGPEVLMGSTRMKAGTAQKLVLNMLSTASMVQSGKVYQNLMIDVKPTNIKLIDRATRILTMAADVEYDTAAVALTRADNRAKIALVMLKTGLGPEEAELRLQAVNGFVRRAIEG
ncbi:N-acetylmuramic acid 6-phosphate etherase [Tumebacillus algifaecis]|uniref:N-acetylmuramic acid 6-phosphate etherase n=1 Tax=Tumebacillus algifaecis TaxID=1214604 RepID=A0A223D748_9BACL|nr:N-acetylmuramic acid 6-phosphate etherase [Tumebacillus algifaecis]ASS77184.1 N-acetylmuramic acid 6-phosphate etherase [Tumebacillus algifaecis]